MTPGPAPPFPVHRNGRRRRQRSRLRRRRNAIVAAVLLVGVPFGIGAAALTATAAFRSSCTLSSLRPISVIGQNSFVYAADGSLLGAIPAEKNRQPVRLEQMSPWMRKATVAVEDRRFYDHGGVDYEGVVRAAFKNLESGAIVQGGSTITQQLVRNLYISNEVTLERKLKEACLAMKLHKAWPRDRILAAYMNQVYYGNRAYGVEAAAQTYFSRHARELTLPQAALLAGLPQAPSLYDPSLRPAAARARRNEVLRAMLEHGDITPAQYRWAASRRKLRLRPSELYTRIREPYFFGYVRDELLARYGPEKVRSGGLRVYSTIHPRFQQAARKAIRDTLYLSSDPAAALVAIDPRTGDIRAMTAETPGKKGNQFNLASQARRQAGSTFKTFVLVAAAAQGINPASASYVSAPFHYQPDSSVEPWDVTTYSHSYLGWTSVYNATLQSDNTVFAQLTLDVGPANVADTARALGIQTPLDPVPALGLGATAVSPLEMASAYATLAAGGIYSKPTAIRKVVLPNGEEDTEAGWGERERRRVIPDGVAYEVTKILERNMTSGTGTGAYFGRVAAGKTGTTDDHADAWFCGYTPNLSTTVWVGYPQAEIPMENVHGISVAGGTFPATIWKLFMERALASSPPLTWKPPTQPAVWRPFTRGEYAIQVSPTQQYSSDDSSTDTDRTTSEPAETTAPARAETRPAPAHPTQRAPRRQAPAPPPAEEPPPPPAEPEPPLPPEPEPEP